MCLAHHGEDADGRFAGPFVLLGGDYDERAGRGQGGEGGGAFDHIVSVQGELLGQSAVGGEGDGCFDRKTDGGTSLDEELRGVAGNRKRRQRRVGRGTGATDRDYGSWRNHPVLRFPGGDFIERNLGTGGGSAFHIHC